ncbi:MAG: NAD-dependent epimerase/dehydratase family protein [Chloroflexota bacterium]|nr:NAD-dependent epimerase/dehydratase family protein [Chloroflexota bacterium]
MRVFITGATGFVGSHIARKLAEAGHDLRILYRSEKKLAILDGLAYKGVAGDLDDLEALKRACDGCELVFHAAAKADYWKDDDKSALWRVNVEGTRNVLSAAQAAGVRRVVFTSSAAAVGIRPGGALADESDRFNLSPERYLYAYSKVKAEEIAAEFAASGLDVVTLNPTVVIGPGDLNAISGTFVIETARYQWAVPIPSGGLAVIDARDVAAAHVNAIERGRSGERYILNSANYPYSEWFAMIAAACDVRAPFFRSPDFMLEPIAICIDALRRFGIETPMDADQTRLGGAFVYFDGSKAHRELFKPEIDIAASLKDTWQWYADRGYIKHNLLTRLIGLF